MSISHFGILTLPGIWKKYENRFLPAAGTSLVPRPWLLPGLATQVQKLVLMGGVMSVLIEVNKILQALNAV